MCIIRHVEYCYKIFLRYVLHDTKIVSSLPVFSVPRMFVILGL